MSLINELKAIFEDIKNEDIKNDLSTIKEINLPKGFKLIVKQPSIELCLEAYTTFEGLILKSGIFTKENPDFIEAFGMILENKDVAVKVKTIIDDKSTILKSKDGVEEVCSLEILFQKGLLGSWLLLRLHILKILIIPFISTLISQMNTQKL